MTEVKAQEARRLLNDICNTERLIERLKDERAAKLTGLDYTAPGPKHHILDTFDREWILLGELCVDFFITAMDTTIRNAEAKIADLRKQLDEL